MEELTEQRIDAILHFLETSTVTGMQSYAYVDCVNVLQKIKNNFKEQENDKNKK